MCKKTPGIPEILRNIDAKIIAASINPNGQELISAIIRYPRWVHAELMTHRMFSRNAASSRAVPVKKMMRMIRDEPAVPEYWGANKAGMQPGDVLTGEELEEVKFIWDSMKNVALVGADALQNKHLHKGLANRILEPFMPYTVLVSATSWGNFFKLRAHKDALPEFQIAAYRMLDQYLNVELKELDWGDWHVPFGDQMYPDLDQETQMKVATARAARLSYLTYDGDQSLEKDLDLYHQLMVAEPLHASPAEHVAYAAPHLWLNTDAPVENHENAWTPDYLEESRISLKRDKAYASSYPLPYDLHMHHQGNFQGFTQYRKTLPQEHAAPSLTELENIRNDRPDWVTL